MASSKKCPKCGEDNPAEAVMCWACYTPLSGQAPLGAGLAGAAASAMPKTAGAPVGVPPSNETPAKKSLDPKTIGIGAFLLVGGVVAVMMSGMMGGSGEPDVIAPPPDGGGGAIPETPFIAQAPAPIPVPVPVPGGGATTTVAAVPAPYKTVASPGNYPTGTVGIMMTNNSAPAGAAKFAKNQFLKNGRWKNMQVVVFSPTEQAMADSFGEYQRDRKNAPLTAGDFQRLGAMGVWKGVPTYLDSRGGRDTFYTPNRSPANWSPGR